MLFNYMNENLEVADTAKQLRIHIIKHIMFKLHEINLTPSTYTEILELYKNFNHYIHSNQNVKINIPISRIGKKIVGELYRDNEEKSWVNLEKI